MFREIRLFTITTEYSHTRVSPLLYFLTNWPTTREEQSFKLKTFSLLNRAAPRSSVSPHFPRGVLLCQGYNEGRFVIMSERAGLNYGYCVPLWWAVKLSASLHAFRSLESSAITKQLNGAQHLQGAPLVNIRLIGKGWTKFKVASKHVFHLDQWTQTFLMQEAKSGTRVNSRAEPMFQQLNVYNKLTFTGLLAIRGVVRILI